MANRPRRILPIDGHIELAAEVGPLAQTGEALDTWRPLLDTVTERIQRP